MSKQTRESGVDRREAIKAALRLGGAAYVAPMVLGAVTPVSARQGSPAGCTGSVCPDITICNDDDSAQGGAAFVCVCYTLATGGGFCALEADCGDVADCGVGNSCPPGFVCVVGTCCTPNANKCIPVGSECGLVTVSGATMSKAPRRAPRGPLTSGRKH